jgi:hypothetical protein
MPLGINASVRKTDQGLNTTHLNTTTNFKNMLQDHYAKSVKTQPYSISYAFSNESQGLFASEVSIVLNYDIENVKLYRGLSRSTKKGSEQSAAETAYEDIVKSNDSVVSTNDSYLPISITRSPQDPVSKPISNSLSFDRPVSNGLSSFLKGSEDLTNNLMDMPSNLLISTTSKLDLLQPLSRPIGMPSLIPVLHSPILVCLF